MALVEMIARLVRPLAVAAFVAAIQGVQGNAVLGSISVASERKLSERKRQGPAGCYAGFGLEFRILTVVDWVEGV